MFLQLDARGPQYLQLARALKQAILDGRCAPGSRLPATRALARELDISRNTALAAYALLSEEGLIEGRSGSGCYVAAFVAMPKRTPAAVVQTPARAPALSRRGQRMLTVYDRAIPGRQHRGLRYNLQYGLPMTNPQLAGAWRRALNQAAARVQADYPDPQGLPGLRAQICGYLARRRGISAVPDDVLVVNGTQQAFALAAEVLLDAGDGMILEDPHYQGARQVFAARGAMIRTCRVDAAGLVTAELPVDGRVRLAVVTPSHQFPTGAVLSLPRRMQLLDWAQRRHAWLIEDDYDGEFRYGARPLAALKSLDRAGRVIYVGSFSKVIFPALRLGYMVLPASLREAMVAAKWLTDRGSTAIEQAALAHLIGSGAFERHLRRAAIVLRARRSALLGALQRLLGDAIEVADSSAGMHILVWLPHTSHAQAQTLVERARARGVGVYLVAPYCHKLRKRPGLLLGYADLPPADLLAAVRILADCLSQIRSG